MYTGMKLEISKLKIQYNLKYGKCWQGCLLQTAVSLALFTVTDRYDIPFNVKLLLRRDMHIKLLTRAFTLALI